MRPIFLSRSGRSSDARIGSARGPRSGRSGPADGREKPQPNRSGGATNGARASRGAVAPPRRPGGGGGTDGAGGIAKRPRPAREIAPFALVDPVHFGGQPI